MVEIDKHKHNTKWEMDGTECSDYVELYIDLLKTAIRSFLMRYMNALK